MSQELERVYTINLGKVKLSQSQHRAVRAINMIREFAQHHMKVETIKIDEELSQQIWAKGVRSPPRKIRVRMSKTDEGHILVSRYDEDVDIESVTPEKETKSDSDKIGSPETPTESSPETPEDSTKDTPSPEKPTESSPEPKDTPSPEKPTESSPEPKDTPSPEKPTESSPEPKDTPSPEKPTESSPEPKDTPSPEKPTKETAKKD